MREMSKAQIEENLREIGIDPIREQLRAEIFHWGGLIFNGHATIEEVLESVPDESYRKRWRSVLFAHILYSMVQVWSEQACLPPKLLDELLAFLLEMAYPSEDIGS